jgi:hypothetical protein
MTIDYTIDYAIHYIFARASLTAAIKAAMPAGMLKAKITAVGAVPQSGSPEDSSNIEPTAAIAVKQAIAKYAPLLGVTNFSPNELINKLINLFSSHP